MKTLLQNGSVLRNNIKLLNRRCSVSTWSPLATAFNHRQRVNLNLSLLREENGLFNRADLIGYDSFYAAKERAIFESNRLIDEATSDKRKRPMVDVFDELSDTLCKVADLSEFIRIAHPHAQYRRAAEDACISISGVVEKLNTHRPLYDALRASVENGDSGDEHVARLFLFDFEQSGIHLDDHPRRRVVKLNDIILQVGQRFMSGAATPRQIPRAAIPANIRQYFGSDSEIVVAGLQVDCSEARVREATYRLYLAPDDQQDLTLQHLLEARKEMAWLCGFPSYADRAINASTMETATNVNEFLNTLSNNLHDRAQVDFQQMLKMKKIENPYTSSVSCWDTPYYSLRAKREWLKVASSEYSPYFSLGGCMEGFNLLLQSLYGITFVHEEMQPGESWAPDVYKLAVMDDANGLLGHIYCDFYERPHKPHQDCHFTIQGGKLLPDGSYQNPIVVVMLSLSAGHWGGPALLTPSAVDNLFHELGHALHSMLGRARYQHVSGTRCPTDLAEVPSVLMEYFAGDPTVLRLFAKHFQTQEPMPEEMLQRLCASKHVFSASEMQQQVFYSALDQRYHGENPLGSSASSTEILKEVQKQYYGLPYVENTAWQHRFSHLVGYGAKYYSYLISRAVAWSVWCSGFADAPLSRASGEALREGVLRHGGAQPPHQLLSRHLAPQPISPESMANALTDELDHHADHIQRVCRITERR